MTPTHMTVPVTTNADYKHLSPPLHSQSHCPTHTLTVHLPSHPHNPLPLTPSQSTSPHTLAIHLLSHPHSPPPPTPSQSTSPHSLQLLSLLLALAQCGAVLALQVMQLAVSHRHQLLKVFLEEDTLTTVRQAVC